MKNKFYIIVAAIALFALTLTPKKSQGQDLIDYYLWLMAEGQYPWMIHGNHCFADSTYWLGTNNNFPMVIKVDSITRFTMDTTGINYLIGLSQFDSVQSNPYAFFIKRSAQNFNFTITDSVFAIMGYQCNKYTCTNKIATVTVYACPTITIPVRLTGSMFSGTNGPEFPGVTGGVLKYIIQMNLNGLNITIASVASNLTFSSLSDSDFVMPQGYTQISLDDLKRMLGKK